VLQEKLKKYAAGKANYIEQFCKYSVPSLNLPILELYMSSIRGRLAVRH
jgi:hypothetical protein